MKKKHLIGAAIAGLAVIAVWNTTFGSPSTAQTVSPPVESEYVVREGDTLWTLAGDRLGDPELWRQVVARNPFLAEPGRYFERDDGKINVLIRPGERLRGLKELGIIPTATDPEPLPLQATPETVAPATKELSWWMTDLGWIALGIILAALLAAGLLWRRSLRRDPATSGPPIVPAGVPNAGEALTRFTAQGARQDFTVLDATPGQLYGAVLVRYADGREHQRLLDAEPGYQARIRRHDGTEESIYMLQRCGNDLRFGGIHRYLPGADFRFVPTAEPVAPAAPAAAAPAAVEPEAAAPAAPSEIACALPGQVVFTLRPADGDKPEMAQVIGDVSGGVTITRDANGVTFRLFGRAQHSTPVA